MPIPKQNTPPLPARDPRAFVHGAGFIFQAAGGLFLFLGCCVGSLSGLIQHPVEPPPGNLIDWLTRSPPGQVISAVNIVVTSLSGLALMVFGIGIQHHRLASATGLVITTTLLVLAWAGTTVAAILLAPGFVRIAFMLAFTAFSVGLLLMALSARRGLRMQPAPATEEPVTPEFLEEFEPHRRIQREIEQSDPDGHGDSGPGVS